MFSRRSDWPRAPNAHAQLVAQARASGRPFIDLTVSNPTEVGLAYPWPRLAEALSDARGARYAPEPLGLEVAREAVSAHYAARGAQVDPAQVVVTASTSEAYALLLKLLADPGDAIAVPCPGYPLLDLLAELEPVSLAPYGLRYDGSWSLAVHEVNRRAAAVVCVSPHNPTGHVLDAAEREQLGALGLPLIVDEVFADYAPGHRSMADHRRSLTFTLSGLSKVAGLPQLKLAWMVVSGPDDARREALARLELIADTFLSVATPVQLALPRLLELGSGIRAQLTARVQQNREALRRARPADAVWDDIAAPNGWYAVLRVPQTESQDGWCARLLEAGVLVQPGHLYDVQVPQVLVLSLLPRADDFARAAQVLSEVIR